MTLPPVAKRDPYNDADWETPTTKGSTVDRVTQRNIEIADRKKRIDAAKSSGTDPGQSQMIAEEAKQYSGAPQDQAGVKDETGLHTPEQTVGSGSQIVRVYTGPGSEGAGKAIAEMGIPILSQWTEGNYQVYKIPSTYDVKMVEEYAKDYGQSKAPVRTEPTYAEEVLQMSIPTEKMTKEEVAKVEKAASQTLIESNIVPTKESVQKVATSTSIKPSSTALLASEDMLNTTIKPSPHEDILQMSIPYEKTTPQERVEITTKIGYQEVPAEGGVGLFSPKSNKKAEEQKKATQESMSKAVFEAANPIEKLGLQTQTLLSESGWEYIVTGASDIIGVIPGVGPEVKKLIPNMAQDIVIQNIGKQTQIRSEEERVQYVVSSATSNPAIDVLGAVAGGGVLGYAVSKPGTVAKALGSTAGKIGMGAMGVSYVGTQAQTAYTQYQSGNIAGSIGTGLQTGAELLAFGKGIKLGYGYGIEGKIGEISPEAKATAEYLKGTKSEWIREAKEADIIQFRGQEEAKLKVLDVIKEKDATIFGTTAKQMQRKPELITSTKDIDVVTSKPKVLQSEVVKAAKSEGMNVVKEGSGVSKVVTTKSGKVTTAHTVDIKKPDIFTKFPKSEGKIRTPEGQKITTSSEEMYRSLYASVERGGRTGWEGKKDIVRAKEEMESLFASKKIQIERSRMPNFVKEYRLKKWEAAKERFNKFVLEEGKIQNKLIEMRQAKKLPENVFKKYSTYENQKSIIPRYDYGIYADYGKPTSIPSQPSVISDYTRASTIPSDITSPPSILNYNIPSSVQKPSVTPEYPKPIYPSPSIITPIPEYKSPPPPIYPPPSIINPPPPIYQEDPYKPPPPPPIYQEDPYKPPPPKRIGKPIYYKWNNQEEKRKREGYDVEVRKGEKRGDKFITVKRNIPRNMAIRTGKEITDEYIEASFRIKKSGKTTKEQDDFSEPNLYKYRRPKPNSKLPKETFVEKRKFRLDTPGEVQQISYFKEQAKKEKNIKSILPSKRIKVSNKSLFSKKGRRFAI